MTLTELKNKTKDIKSQLDSANGKCELLKASLEKTAVMKQNLEINKLQYIKAVELLTVVQKLTREKTCHEFETIVTYALQYIFNRNYEFRLEFGKRGNLPELEFKLKTEDIKETIGICDASGGGIVDIAALALRLVLLEISKNNGVLVLDECLKHLSAEYRPAAYEFLKSINAQLNRQIIFVTHADEFINNAEYKIKIGE